MKRYLRLGTGLTLLSLLFLTGCELDGKDSDSDIPVLSVEVLQLAPRELNLLDQEYKLETFLWRDFMPVSPPDGKPMIALIKVIEKNEVPIASDLELKYLWMINGQEIWSTKFTEETPLSPDNELHRIAREGPQWDPGIEVDVVVGLTRGDGSMKLLRARDQLIHRTD